MADEVSAPRCPAHPDADAVGTCARCGRFTCAQCGRVSFGAHLCDGCLARPEARLAVSARAKQALLCAVLGLLGVVVLLPVGAWLARSELREVALGRSPEAGRDVAKGALTLAAVATVAWLVTFGVLALRSID